MNIALLSNVNISFLLENYRRQYKVFEISGYGSWEHYIYNDESLMNFKPSVILLLLDGWSLYNGLKESSYNDYLEKFSNNILNLSQKFYKTNIIISNIHVNSKNTFSGTYINNAKKFSYRFEKMLDNLSASNVIKYDLEGDINRLGINNAYSPKYWYLGAIPYSLKCFNIIKLSLDKIIEKIYYNNRKKVLVLDLDNTIWGGALGDIGSENIELSNQGIGQIYRDVQRLILDIKSTGILLAISSKNNLKTVQEAFENNPFMILSIDDFVSVKANWEKKSISLSKMSEELNVGLQSFVFIDDNSVEREMMKLNLPEVTVPDFPNQIEYYPDFISKIFYDYFWVESINKEDSIKSELYINENKRTIAKSKFSSIQDFINDLEIKIYFGAISETQYDRVLKLINKTNQFNTTNIRMNRNEMINYIENNNLFCAEVEDKVGIYGLVVVIMFKRNGDTIVIDNMIMSCRVMNRLIENKILSSLITKWSMEGVKYVLATYVETNKNIPVASLWDSLGFDLIKNSNKQKSYRLNINDFIKEDYPLQLVWKNKDVT